jgi:hypothetical protein
MKKLNFRSISATLTNQEMKKVLGGEMGSCLLKCNPDKRETWYWVSHCGSGMIDTCGAEGKGTTCNCPEN